MYSGFVLAAGCNALSATKNKKKGAFEVETKFVAKIMGGLRASHAFISD